MLAYHASFGQWLLFVCLLVSWGIFVGLGGGGLVCFFNSVPFVCWKSFQNHFWSLLRHINRAYRWCKDDWFWWDSCVNTLHAGCSLALGMCADSLVDFLFCKNFAFLFSGIKCYRVNKTVDHCCCDL